jgi:hypothetical protein
LKRTPRRAILDTNLLLLWLVAETDAKILERFKRVQEFTAVDIELLSGLLVPYNEMVTTPHILSETSNFIDQAPPPYRELLIFALRRFITEIAEVYSPANKLIARKEFNILGLTDAGMVELSESAVVITRDFRLAGMILAAGGNAINFTQSRSGYLLSR